MYFILGAFKLLFKLFFLFLFFRKKIDPHVCLCVCVCVGDQFVVVGVRRKDKICDLIVASAFTTIKYRRRSLLCLPRCTRGRGSRSASSLASNCSGSGPSSSNPPQSGRSRDGSRSNIRCRTLKGN